MNCRFKSTTPIIVIAVSISLFVLVGCSDDRVSSGGNDVGNADAGVGDASNEDNNDELCPFERNEEGECALAAPRGTPSEECPSGEFRSDPSIDGLGICLPEAPQGKSEWECPSGKLVSDGMMDKSGVCLPVRPRLRDWDCPDGWPTERLPAGADESAGTFAGCRPPDMPDSCDDGQWPSLRDGGCVEHGTVCPDGDQWLDEIDIQEVAEGFDGQVLYVDAESTVSDPIGSRQAPFAQIGVAIAAADAGDIVAVGKGTYEEAVTIDDGIAVVGACVHSTIISWTTSGMSAVTVNDAGGVYVGNLSVEGSLDSTGEVRAVQVMLGAEDETVHLEDLHIQQGGVLLSGDGNAELRDLMLGEPHQSEGVGLRLRGSGMATVDGLWIRSPGQAALRIDGGFEPKVSDAWITDSGALTRGTVYIGSESNAELERVVLNRSRARGVSVFFEARASVRDLYFIGAADQHAMTPAVRVNNQGQLHGERVFIDGRWSRDIRRGFEVDDGELDVTQLVVQGQQRLEGWYTDGMAIGDEGRVNLEEALFYTEGTTGIRLNGGELTVTDMVVTSRFDEAEDLVGTGIFMRSGEAELRRVEIGGLRYEFNGIEVVGAAGLDIQDVGVRWALEPTRYAATNSGGMYVGEDSRVDGQRLLLEGAAGYGVTVQNSAFSARDVTIRNGHAVEDIFSSGKGVEAVDGEVDLERFIISDNFYAGIIARGDDTFLRLSDGVIRRISPGPLRNFFGFGIHLLHGVELEMERVVVRDVSHIGLNAEPEGIVIRADDIRISQVDPVRDLDDGERVEGRGVYIHNGSLQGRRWWVDNAHAYGVWVGGSEGSIDLQDVVVEDIYSEPGDGGLGLGAMAFQAADLKLSRAMFRNVHHVGVWGFISAHIDLEDTVIAGIRGRELDNSFGIGFGAAADSRATLQRVVVERSQLAGLMAMGDTEISGRDVRITRTVSAECSGDSCEFPGGGVGVSTRISSATDLERFTIEESILAGIQIDADSHVNIRNGWLRKNRLGVNIQAADFEIDEGFFMVYLEDNEQDMSTHELAMPSVSDLAESIGLESEE